MVGKGQVAVSNKVVRIGSLRRSHEQRLGEGEGATWTSGDPRGEHPGSRSSQEQMGGLGMGWLDVFESQL